MTAFAENDLISDGSDVLIVLDERKRWLAKVISGQQFHCHKGFFDFDQIIGKPFGTKVKTNKSVYLTIYDPIPSDFLKQISHSSQIIYTKDAGSILMNGGIKPGIRVIEAGTGSGALTSILATYVGSEGHVYTYENREDAINTAKKNLSRIGVESIVSMKLKDVSTGFEEKNVDAIVLDLGDPEIVIPHAYESLKYGGIITIFIPTYNQIERVLTKLLEFSFDDIKAHELIKRDIQLKPHAIRPNTRMIGHTGYLIFARKAFREVE
ncbi:MAG: tRNA (adenine(57)-N(1)/adenine(58)-N(1))-methyltransferase TrmI [Candidatus Heimdallarchaeota archaeon AB_125]|nr:MAG: tRNA (adenine(57)-N(1)/adenine(58)-N(1))-methyltransferase TrmI [Candidatus Heimdallarchaeota archaeon AB_125]